MAVRAVGEILDVLKNYEPATPDDAYLGLLEDISDSIAGNGSLAEEIESLRSRLVESEQKVKDTETEWRQRYRDRFYGKTDDTGVIEAKALEEPEVEVVKTVEEVAEEWM